MELSNKLFEFSELAEIQNKTEYVLTKQHEDNVLELEGYYSTIYISKYNDNTYFFSKEKIYFSCNTLEELIYYINEL